MKKITQQVLCTLIIFSVFSVFAQESSTEPVVIEVTRVQKQPQEIPAAVSTVGQDDIQLSNEQLGLDESLSGVPGLFMLNKYNFAQDLRASIRGFGARSSFGIRGIKIIVDGIPETLPDGQGSVDGIDLGSARQISVIRGPASSLYGNASGGAIVVESERGTAIPFVEARITAGDYDFSKFQLKSGGENGRLNYLFNLSDTTLDGYRDHSEFENTQFNTRLEYELSGTSSLLTTLHYTDQPVANDPGGINEADAEDDPTQARDRNVEFDAGEALEQTRLGLLYKTDLSSERAFEARLYNTNRDFTNKLPFEDGGSVVLDRSFIGGGVKYIMKDPIGGNANRFLVGLDYDLQDDDRERYDNLSGVVGPLVFDQNEKVTALGLYLQNETRLSDTTELTLGLRYDEIEFDVSDNFLGDGDDSGDVSLDAVSPMVGLSVRISDDTRLYTTVSEAFETPTTTEFANPDGGGFNQSLDPQESTNYEVGLKTLAQDYQFELAVFHIDVDNELTPFELAAQPGRTFFENAGSSTRDGIELAYSRSLLDQLHFSLSYTYSKFEFDRFTNEDGDEFDGNQIPGIPEDFLHLSFAWKGETGLYANWDTSYSGELFADNANDVEVDAYSVTNIRFGYNGFIEDMALTAFLGVNNLFDEEYNSNIRINAFGGRFYEPAPEQNIFAGVSLRMRFDR